jgi:hypothetical protein
MILRKTVVVYPLELLIGRQIVIPLAFLLMQYFEGITIGDWAFVGVWAILFYLFGQYRYARIEITDEAITQIFIASFYLKPRVYRLDDIERFFFQYHVGNMVDPYVRPDLRSGKKKKIRMSSGELRSIQLRLEEDTNIPIVKAKRAYDRP